MSLAVSPHQSKRLLEQETQLLDDDSRVPLGEYNPQKRFKHLGSPSGRCGGGHHAAYAVGSSTVAALCSLFPQMDDKAIARVLEEYGHNVDAAIKHLNELQLAAPGSSEQHARQEQQRQGLLGPTPAAPSLATPAAPAAAASAAAAAAPPAAAGNSAPGERRAPASARTADEWIAVMVQQMSAADSVEDARRRASDVLGAFEQAVLQHADTQPGSAGRAAELERENALLKRAVTIQNARLQELTGREAEANALREELQATRARVHVLESHNFSLQVHLKQAAAPGRDPMADTRNPHVF